MLKVLQADEVDLAGIAIPVGEGVEETHQAGEHKEQQVEK